LALEGLEPVTVIPNHQSAGMAETLQLLALMQQQAAVQADAIEHQTQAGATMAQAVVLAAAVDHLNLETLLAAMLVQEDQELLVKALLELMEPMQAVVAVAQVLQELKVVAEAVAEALVVMVVLVSFLLLVGPPLVTLVAVVAVLITERQALVQLLLAGQMDELELRAALLHLMALVTLVVVAEVAPHCKIMVAMAVQVL
jgi:hypothetical protein